MNDFKWLLFDLGGVLAEFVGPARMKAWMRSSFTDAEFLLMWLRSPACRAFESGKLGLKEFAVSIVNEFDMHVSPATFAREFPLMVTGYFPGAEELLRELSARHSIALLSNTNASQWDHLCSISQAHTLLNRIFLSFQTGLLKPDPEVFQYTARELGCAPEAIAFFDDNPDNIKGAQAVGMRAYETRGMGELRGKLGELGLI